MAFQLPAIYPITDRTLSGLSILEQVRRLIAGGAAIIQIREKDAPVRSFIDDAVRAAAYARERRVKVIVNDRVDLAMVLQADGVHLGQEDLPTAEARRLLGGEAIIGYSTHTVAQAKEATGLPVDYLAFGPVFPTFTKLRPDPVVGVEALMEISRLAGRLPVVAIGGINESNVGSVLGAGASSAAVISGVPATDGGIEKAMERLTAAARPPTNIVIQG